MFMADSSLATLVSSVFTRTSNADDVVVEGLAAAVGLNILSKMLIATPLRSHYTALHGQYQNI